jgi:hypothetical protein
MLNPTIYYHRTGIAYHSHVPKLEPLHCRAYLVNTANEFVTGDKPGGNMLVSAIPVQVTATQRSDADFQDHVALILDLRSWSILHADLSDTLEDGRFHGLSLRHNV